ncbi:hypothetical protein TNCV_3574021 [Trichonephila clavipes]|nr:hypothetical protein TNCV_3574021 [Trichonephila clavipes]
MIKAATEIVEKKQNLSSDIVKCGISVDGTWQRRCYTSMNGCVAAISVDTGKVLDIEVIYVVLLSNIMRYGLLSVFGLRETCRLDVYGIEATSDSKVRKWARKFKDGRTNVHDEECSGRPSVITDDLMQTVETKIRENRSS